MLLTNQKTINYENSYKKLKGNHPFLFVLQIYSKFYHFFCKKYTLTEDLTLQRLKRLIILHYKKKSTIFNDFNKLFLILPVEIHKKGKKKGIFFSKNQPE